MTPTATPTTPPTATPTTTPNTISLTAIPTATPKICKYSSFALKVKAGTLAFEDLDYNDDDVVESHCLDKCGTCDICQDSQSVKNRFEGKNKSCASLANQCSDSDVAITCRVTYII